MLYLVIVGSLFSMKTERKTSDQVVVVVQQLPATVICDDPPLPVQGCVSLLGHVFAVFVYTDQPIYIFHAHTFRAAG